MKTYEDAVSESFTDEGGYLGFRFGPDGEYELALEPLVGGMVAIGLYRNHELLLEQKVPVRPAHSRGTVPKPYAEDALCWSVGAPDGGDPAFVVSGPVSTVRVPLNPYLAHDIIVELEPHAAKP